LSADLRLARPLCSVTGITQLIHTSALEALRDALYKYSTTTTTTTTVENVETTDIA